MAYGINAPFGLQPSTSKYSSDFKLNQYKINPAYITSIFTGDPVMMLSDGTIGKWVTAGPGLPENPTCGTFWGCQFISAVSSNQGNVVFAPVWTGATAVAAGTQVNALIHDSPATEYDVQASISGTVPAATSQLGILQRNINQNANMALGGTFNDAPRIAPDNPASGVLQTGLSRMYLDISTISSAKDLLLKIVRLTPQPKNKIYTAPGGLGIGNGNQGAFNNVICTLNNIEFNGGSGNPGGGQLTVVQGALASVNILAMGVTPVQILAAPAAGFAHVVNSFVLSVSNLNNNTAYAAGGISRLQYGNTTLAGGTAVTSGHPATVFTTQGALGPFTYTGLNVTPVTAGIFISNTVANFTTGTPDYQYTLTYTTVPI